MGNIFRPVSPKDAADSSKSEYEVVAASTTDQPLGSTGAIGDFFDRALIVPSSLSPAAITVKDGGGSAITIFAGGTNSLTSLVPFSVPLGLKSRVGAWTMTTGAGVSNVVVSGNFTV